jgi:uncharacterized protein (TIGR02001 family)
MKTLHKTAISAAAVALLSGLASTAVLAEEAAAPEVSPITANVTVASSYIYRGITQTNNKPAIQGGFDYAHESGFYVGNWNSSISWISDGYGVASNGGANNKTQSTASAPVEMDFYAGFKKELIGEGFASDFGVLQYYYPTTGLGGVQTQAYIAANPNLRQAAGVNPSTTELYAAQNFTFGPVTGFGKFSYAVTNLFGLQNSKGAFYPDLTANYDTGFYGITVNAHVGYQYVPNNVVSTTAQVIAAGNPASLAGTWNASYADWKLGLTKDFGGGLSGTAYYTGTSAQKVGSTYVYSTPNGGNAGRGNAVVALTKTF